MFDKLKGKVGSGGYHTEYPVKAPDDTQVMAYILDHTNFSFDEKAFAEAEEKFGDRIAPGRRSYGSGAIALPWA